MIFITKSPIHGEGVFTNAPIMAGTRLFKVADLSRRNRFPTWITRIGSKVNHQERGNCFLKKSGDVFYAFASRYIAPFEEITSDYTKVPKPFKTDTTGFKN